MLALLGPDIRHFRYPAQVMIPSEGHVYSNLLRKCPRPLTSLRLLIIGELAGLGSGCMPDTTPPSPTPPNTTSTENTQGPPLLPPPPPPAPHPPRGQYGPPAHDKKVPPRPAPRPHPGQTIPRPRLPPPPTRADNALMRAVSIT
jgi:hypothetical protein